ncbi:methyltransferase [Saccharopolyspora sp. NPDC000359]|uniref:methyltransferase n=1 Tax=Saccharopolyspora sp. NPDC000359 TaxID=3154251 RepID=UPI00332C8FCE
MDILKLAVSGWFARSAAVAARLGIPDLLAGEHLSSDEIAERTGTRPEVVRRLMQVLTVPGVVLRDDNGDFTLNEAFAQLRSDHPQTLRHFFILSAETYDDAWGGLLHTVRTGESGFEQVFGLPLYEYLEKDADTADLFDRAMVDLARPVAAELVRHHDFTGLDRVVDVGGGAGAMLKGILGAQRELRGVVADRASVCERGAAELADSGDADLAERLSFEPSDFFASVPVGGDRYLLKNVLHDWTVENRVRILSTVADAMRRTAESGGQPRLLVIEPLVESDQDGWRALFQMLICDEGMDGLDEDGMRQVLGTAGFDVVSTVRLATGHTVLDCAVRPA